MLQLHEDKTYDRLLMTSDNRQWMKWILVKWYLENDTRVMINFDKTLSMLLLFVFLESAAIHL